MGYFSNGSEGDIYRNRYCRWCQNDGDEKDDTGCVVWDLHLLHNRSDNDGVREVLDMLIPQEDGRNGKCSMFRPVFDQPEP